MGTFFGDPIIRIIVFREASISSQNGGVSFKRRFRKYVDGLKLVCFGGLSILAYMLSCLA